MSHVIRYEGLVGAAVYAEDVPLGAYLRSYDAEANAGMGEARWTTDPGEAFLFETSTDAFELWRRVPRNRPFRPDGEPNRPLTVFSVAIERLEVQHG